MKAAAKPGLERPLSHEGYEGQARGAVEPSFEAESQVVVEKNNDSFKQLRSAGG